VRFGSGAGGVAMVLERSDAGIVHEMWRGRGRGRRSPTVSPLGLVGDIEVRNAAPRRSRTRAASASVQSRRLRAAPACTKVFGMAAPSRSGAG